MNQCQGCQAGWPKEKFKPWTKGSKPFFLHSVIGGYEGEKIMCTEYKYQLTKDNQRG